MDTVFPVELLIQDRLFQAFTRDVSAGGMRLEIKIFDRYFEQEVEKPQAQIGLMINPTFSRTPIKATARVAWASKKETAPASYILGVAYTEIDEISRRRLIRHARWLLWLPRLGWTSGAILMILLALLTIHDQALIRENKRLVSQIVESASQKSNVASQLYELQRRKVHLDEEVEKAKKRIQKLENSITAQMVESDTDRQTQVKKELADIVSRRDGIKQEMLLIQSDREKLQSSYHKIKEKQKPLEVSALKQMYGWLQSHQNFKTGLVASYEGDEKLKDIAFTYDQALAAQAFLVFGHPENAAAILNFFETEASGSEGGFFNAYDAVDGRATEKTVNTGPNAWIGITALQYERRASVKGKYLPLARRIGDWILGFQDAEGGLSGGPSVEWYSTEHNLDVYAFFSMLAEETREDRYRLARDRSLEWIKKYAYSATQGRINRGKGDSTIATDTFSWAVAAIGPARLKKMEFDPEAIMAFASDHCGVTVDFLHTNGKTVSVKGFDFARAQHVGRGGVISTEWTSQMIVSYRILSDYFRSLGNENKAQLYLEKADFYLSEVQKMIITSPSKTGQGRGCLPYASHDDVDTGHGWRSPKGRSTGSVAGTAYTLFAWSGYNPFDLRSLEREKVSL